MKFVPCISRGWKRGGHGGIAEKEGDERLQNNTFMLKPLAEPHQPLHEQATVPTNPSAQASNKQNRIDVHIPQPLKIDGQGRSDATAPSRTYQRSGILAAMLDGRNAGAAALHHGSRLLWAFVPLGSLCPLCALAETEMK